MTTLFKSVLGAFVAVFATISSFAADVTLPSGVTEASFGDNTVTDGTTYYTTLQAAVEAVCGNDGAALYCKPSADVGSLQHAPVTSTLTVYGNGASVTGGAERDFDIGNTDPNGPGAGKVITADMTLTVKDLDGCGAWGNKTTEHTVNLVFESCKNMGKVFITGTTGTLNITITDCAFEGVINQAVYSNADGEITLTNVDFSNLIKAVNLNHKATGTQTVTIKDCSFVNCGNNVSADEIPVRVLSSVEGGKSVLTVESCSFTGTPEGGADILLPDGNGSTEATVSATAASVSNEGTMIEVKADETYSNQAPANVAKIGEVEFATLEEAVAAAKSGDEITILADVTLSGELTLPAGIALNGNGKQINGNIVANGDLTFVGHAKVTSFNAGYNKPTITIGAGACLEMNGTGRMVIGHGATFNITGTVADAKTADKATLTPSLVMPGASFTGAGVTFNVNNAYIKTTASYCSSSKSASGTFDFNINNSIWEQFGKLAFEAQSTAATVNFELKDSVLTTTSHLVFGVVAGEVVIDNSNVNVGKRNQIENRSTMTIKNGSVVNGAVATSSNAINPGTIIVENATYDVTGQFSGAAEGTGTLIIKNGANVSVGSIVDKANIQIDATGMSAGDEINFTANLSKFAGTVEVINNDKLEASIVDGKIVLSAKPVAKIGDTPYATLEEAIAAAQEGETITLISDINYVNVASQQDKTTSIYIPAGKKFTLDLNGYTISGENNVNGSFAFVTICRGADIIIDDTSANKSGKITYKSTREKSDYNQKGYTIGAMGTLVLNGGTIENSTPLGSDGFEKCVTTAIDIAASNGEMASFTMNGGVVISETYFAIRANVYEGNKVNSENVVVLNAGTVHGLHFCDWGSKDLNYKVAIGKDAVIECGNYVDYPDQSIRLIIAGAAASEVSIDIAEEAQIKGSVYSPIARVGKMYSYNLTKAIAAAQEGGTIELLKDISVSDSVTIDKAITLVGNDKTLKFDLAASAFVIKSSNVVIKNMTIEQGVKDNSFHISIDKGAWDAPSIQYSDITIQNVNFIGGDYALCLIGEDVIVDSCTFDTQDSHNIIVYSLKGDSKIINNTFNASKGNNKSAILYEGGPSTSLTGDALAAFLGGGTLTVAGNTATGKGVFFQFTNWGLVKNVSVEISGNKIDAFTNKAIAIYDMDGAVKANGDEFGTFVVKNNVFTNVPEGRPILKEYTGTVEVDASENYLGSAGPDYEALLVGDKVTVDSYYTEVSEDGTLGGLVSIEKHVAKIGDTNYETLADAFAAAQDGDTITLLGDCEQVSGIDIEKNITVDGAGYKVYAADIADDTEMFNIRSKVTITNLTFDADHKFSYGIQVQNDADVTLSDVSILYAGNNNWGAAVNLNDGKLFVSGDFTAFSGGENGGAFPFTGILYWSGEFKFADGVTASIADPTGATANSDLLLVGAVGLLSIEDANRFLSQFNIPSGFAPYTLALDADIVSSFGGFTGASPLPWNTIIDYGKQILDAIGENTTETQVTVGLLDDTVIPDVFVYEDANFSINGNGKKLTGTIDVTDNVGTISNVVLTSGTTFVMTNVTTGCVKFGDNVTVAGQVTIVPPANYGVGSVPLIEFAEGSAVKPEDFVIDQSVELPEGTEFVVDGNKIVLGTPVAKIGDVKYASLSGAIAAAQEGGTVTLLKDISVSDSILIDKSLVLDLNSKIITSSHNRSIKINTNGNAAKTVIIKNGTVISTPDAGRCIQLMGDALERLELNGVTFKAENGQSSQTITLAETNSTKPLEFVVKNSTVVASNNNGYACIFFCPIDATIENSTISGYAALYFKNAGVANTSEGSVVDVIDSNLIGTNVQGGKNTFGTITTEANNVTINVSGGSITANKTNDALQTIVYCGWYASKSTGLVASLNTELLLGDGCRILDVNEDISAQTVAVRAEYADEVAAEGFSVGSANENGLVSIVAPVAKIGETKYTSLADAVAAVTDNTETTIELIKDVTLSSSLEVPANKTIVLDLNGKVLTCGADGYCIVNEAGSAVTIKDSVGSGVVNGVVYNDNGSTMIIDGGTYNAIGSFAILNCAATMTINGGVINGKDSYPIYSYNDGHKLTINNVTVNGECGCINAYYAGEVIINDGTFNFTGREGNTFHIVYVSTGTTMTINGGSFKKVGDVDLNVEGGGGVCVNGTGKLIVTGGTFDGAINDIDNYSANTTIKISGGTYTQDVKDWCSEGYLCAKQPDTDPAIYKVGKLPNAEVVNMGPTEITDYKVYNGSSLNNGTAPINLQVALDFISNDTEKQAQENAFGQYTTDFYITINGAEGGSFVANGCYLAGNYGAFGWVMIPLDGMTIENGKVYPVISSVGFDFSYEDICTQVKDFKCGIYFSPEVLEANPNLTVSLNLGLSETIEQAQSATFTPAIEKPYSYDVEDMTKAVAIVGSEYFTTFAEAVAAAMEFGYENVKVVDNTSISGEIAINKNLILDLNGKTLTVVDGASIKVENAAVKIAGGILAGIEVADIALDNATLTLPEKMDGDFGSLYTAENEDGSFSIATKFQSYIQVVDGVPCIGFLKDVNNEYKLMGKGDLTDAGWTEIDAGAAAEAKADPFIPLYWAKPEGAYRFFWVDCQEK